MPVAHSTYLPVAGNRRQDMLRCAFAGLSRDASVVRRTFPKINNSTVDVKGLANN
ncbi:6693_t:CDS:2 [Dentiscutata heterogama]|uniref:6693_t:CDS:1 n=1 Tax=Dentiscutata heterogama TaxID=1316150 RepID=A0ACA9JYW5_9GLOM|nr:6693_t:CDS:2 [Dentiscutata heterogama]